MDRSFVWITTDDVTSRPAVLAINGSFPDYYRGIIGTMAHLDVAEISVGNGRSASDFTISSLKVADGLRIIYTALQNLDTSIWESSPGVTCNSSNIWADGEIVYSEMIRVFHDGVDGTSTHHDESPRYDIMNFKSDHFEKIGMWEYNSTDIIVDQKLQNVVWADRNDIVYIGGGRLPPSGFGSSLTGYHLRIGIVPEPPIAFLSDNCINNTSSPKCWYGWNPDIFEQLANDLNFTYEYVIPADMKYGGYNKESKRWNGMVGDLLARKTDLTVALSINMERAKWIDFSASFFEDQASFVVNEKPSTSSSNMFFFLEPFHISVWLSIIGLILVVALLTTLFGKFSPFGSFGKKHHAIKNCLCSECSIKKEEAAAQKDNFSDVNTQQCLVEKVADDIEDSNDMSFYNSAWLVGTGEQSSSIFRHAHARHNYSGMQTKIFGFALSLNLNLIFQSYILSLHLNFLNICAYIY